MRKGIARQVAVIQQAAKRSLIVFVTGLVWFLITPYIFIWGLPQFDAYDQFLINYYGSANTANIASVYQFWTVVPEVLLFFVGIFWAGGILEWIGDHVN